ncbi:MAG: class II aldolase/adducin family protein [Lachnospiraceae bacterium]
MQDFINISKYAGMRNDLAQAGGGNTSVKLDDRIMLVKSSGFQLADMKEQTGYSKVDYKMIVEYFREHVEPYAEDVFTEEQGNQLLKEAQIEGGHASIETFLHAITGKYTLHSHPLLVNILTAREDAETIVHELFPKAVFVPYRKPGAALAEAYDKIYRAEEARGTDKTIVFLQNHGLLVSGDDGDEVIGKTEQILAQVAEYVELDDSAYRAATQLYRVTRTIDVLAGNIVYLSENRYLSREYAGSSLVEQGMWEHAFCPDCVVYAGKKLLWLKKEYDRQDILDFVDAHGLPTLLYYEGYFYILAESVKKAQEIENVMSFAARVQYVNQGRKMHYLNHAQEEELLNWDAEKYRRKKV